MQTNTTAQQTSLADALARATATVNSQDQQAATLARWALEDHLDEIRFKKLCEAERAAERAHLRAHTLPSMHGHSYLASPLLLVTPVFSIARRVGNESVHVDQTFEANGRGTVRYVGPRLSQSHQTLLFSLLKSHAGRLVWEPIYLTCRQLLAAMAWGDSPQNRARLRELLDDLHHAHLRLWHTGSNELEDAVRTTVIAEWQPSSDETAAWRIQLSPTAVNLFSYKQPTYLDMHQRGYLREGLATFLHGFIAANDCSYAYRLSYLQQQSGSTAKGGDDFLKQLKGVLQQLQIMGVIAGYTTSRGQVKIEKTAPAPKTVKKSRKK